MKKIYFILAGFVFSFSAFAQPVQPGPPLACNSSNCTAATSETCPPGGPTVVTTFNGSTLRSGSPTSLPALYTFYNIATVSGTQINATVTIDAAVNVSMTGTNFNIDDNTATDQLGNSIASFFAPRITSSSNLTTSDLRGYVQFTLRFYVENGTAGEQYSGDYTTLPPLGGLTGLNYIHYDIDGSTVGTGGWFRETGVVQNVAGLSINADVTTELLSYTYTDGGTWKGFAGSVCERTGVSRCAQVAASASFPTPQTQITFRMGYDYNYNGTSFNSQPTRQYGSRFGCFTFPQPSTLPVLLKSFSALRNQQTANVSLKWTSSAEINNVGFEIQRNLGNDNWQTIGFVKSQAPGGNSTSDINYSYDDFNNSKSVSQYRLRQIDIDAKIKYSEIRSVRGLDQKIGIIIYPNPTNDGKINIVFEDKSSVRDISVIDMSGRMVKQMKNITANSIQIDNLTPGMYSIKVVVPETGEQAVEKIVVNKR